LCALDTGVRRLPHSFIKIDGCGRRRPGLHSRLVLEARGSGGPAV